MEINKDIYSTKKGKLAEFKPLDKMTITPYNEKNDPAE